MSNTISEYQMLKQLKKSEESFYDLELLSIFGAKNHEDMILLAKVQKDEIEISRMINSRLKILLGIGINASNYELLKELQKDKF